MVSLSFWEKFIVQAAISLLSALSAAIKNPTELAAIQAAIAFLSRLLGEQVVMQ